jgi:hypothetical protein
MKKGYARFFKPREETLHVTVTQIKMSCLPFSGLMMTKRKQYDGEQMERAISAVKQKKMKIRLAAKEFQVPKSTLSDKLKGRYKGMKPGPRTELTDEEEKALVHFLLYMANQGFPLTRSMTRCFIIDIIKQSGTHSLKKYRHKIESPLQYLVINLFLVEINVDKIIFKVQIM